MLHRKSLIKTRLIATYQIESVEKEPTSENNVDSMTETTEPPAMVQQTEPKVEPPTQKVVVVEQPIAEEPVVEEPVQTPSSLNLNPKQPYQVEPKQEVEVTPTPTTEEPLQKNLSLKNLSLKNLL